MAIPAVQVVITCQYKEEREEFFQLRVQLADCICIRRHKQNEHCRLPDSLEIGDIDFRLVNEKLQRICLVPFILLNTYLIEFADD